VYANTYGLTAYPGYPVVQVNNLNEIVVIAPNISANVSGISITLGTDLVFVPTLFTEKNIKTNYVAGPKGIEVVGVNPDTGTHAEKINDVYSYGILKKLSNGFSALILSNTSDGVNSPVAANDTMLLDECGVNTDDYVFLNGFSPGANGQYKLVAHDGKNTMILHNSSLPLTDVLLDAKTRNVNEVGTTWWGKELEVVDTRASEVRPLNPLDYTIDPRPIRIVDAESVLPGCKLKIASAALGTANWFSQSLVGVWNITKIGYYGPSNNICQYIEFEIPNGAPNDAQHIIVDPANEASIGFTEKAPFAAFRLAQGWAIDPKNIENAQVYLTPSKSYQKISDSLGTEIQCVHKLGYETVPKTGSQ
jgi:hypothetical protein